MLHRGQKGFRHLLPTGIITLLLAVNGWFSTAEVRAADTSLPRGVPWASGAYQDEQIPSVLKKLQRRATREPLNVIATVIFALAIIHTFVTDRFRRVAHRLHERCVKLEQQQSAGAPSPEAASEYDRTLFWMQVYHFMGEVEAVFGIWLVPLFLAIIALKGWSTMVTYVGQVNVAEAIFVVVIMAIAASRPILRLAEGIIGRVARLGRGTPGAWWLAILTVGPLLGSFITEPAAMTICALLLRHHFFSVQPSRRFKYATVGLLFVNISVGGTLSHFAAPPVVIVANRWQWDFEFMFTHFGWKATVAILLSNASYFIMFRRELGWLRKRKPDRPDPTAAHRPVPARIVLVHVLFLVWSVANAHYPVLIILGFLFFLAFVEATRPNQQTVALRSPLLVGFFLAALVIHGGCQEWWITPVLSSLSKWPLLFGSALLTSFNDNAAITYLATLVPNFSDTARYAVMAGAVAGGGLTVIANAPNPAGQAILASRFGEGGIAPFGLFLGALLPTMVVLACFSLLP